MSSDNASEIAKNAGYTAKTFKGIPIAIEHNKDGSITLCKEVVEEIVSDKDVPLWIKDLL